MLIGLTGGIGSGKSTVARFWEILDVPVYYADARAKQILAEDPDVVASVTSLLGAEAYSDGVPDRAYIASRVFEDGALRDKLNGIIHPAVGRDFESWIVTRSDRPYLLKEAAIIVETGTVDAYDALVLVTAPEAVRMERVIKRGGISRKDVEQRIASQLGDAEKRRFADYIIDNDGKNAVVPAVLSIHEALCEKLRA